MSKSIKNTITITIAMAIITAAIYFFLVPSKIIIGSVSGLAMVLEQIIHLPISLITLVLNASLLVLAFICIGKEFAINSIYTSLLLPFYLAVFEKLFPITESLTQNSVYDLVAYTLIIAFGQAILFRINASSGGLDIIAKILNKYFHLDIGKAMTITGLLISASSLIVYDIGTLVVSVLGTFANGQAVDYFIDGFNKKKKICILSENYEEIQEYIMHTLKRGVTIYTAQGGYDKKPRIELVTIMNPNEYKKLLHYLDESHVEAFVTVYTVNEVHGTWNKK